MVYRLDLILADGTRRRAVYDSRAPQVVEMARNRLTAQSDILNGAVIVTSNAEASKLLEINGFSVQQPQKGNNFCIRFTDDLAQEIFRLSKDTGKNEASLIRTAVVYWLENGHPMSN